MNEKISIIVPAYNIEAYLGKCLDSILEQTYANIEVIVVNDGSKDGTRAIMDDYVRKDNRIKAIHKENGGVTSARLVGIKAATGSWVGFVDGDDFVDPDMYEHLLRNAKAYHADISHCGYQMVLANRVDYYYNTGVIVQQDRVTGLSDLLEGKFVEPGLWNKLYKKSLFNDLICEQKIPLEIKINEDLLMNYWLFQKSNLAIYEDFCPYHYVLRSGSATTSDVNHNKLGDPIKVIKLILDDVRGEEPLERITWVKLLRWYIYIMKLPNGKNKKIVYSYKQLVKKELKKLRKFVISYKGISLKFKCMVLWISLFPQSYILIHKLYSKLLGYDKKYEV